MYDIITRMPLIVWSPGRFEAATHGGRALPVDGHRSHHPRPGRCAVPESLEAETLLPALEGRDWQERPYVFAEHPGDAILTETDFMTMVRTGGTGSWSTSWASPSASSSTWRRIPDENHNLWDDPGHAEIRAELLDTLRDWLIESNYRTRDWMAEAR